MSTILYDEGLYFGNGCVVLGLSVIKSYPGAAWDHSYVNAIVLVMKKRDGIPSHPMTLSKQNGSELAEVYWPVDFQGD